MSLDPQLFQLKSTVKALLRKRKLCASAERTAMEMCRASLAPGAADGATRGPAEAARAYAEEADRRRAASDVLHRWGPPGLKPGQPGSGFTQSFSPTVSSCKVSGKQLQFVECFYPRLCCRLDAVVRTVQGAVALGRVCPSMVRLVQALDAASRHLDCEALEAAAESFEKAFPRCDLENHTPAALTTPGEHEDNVGDVDDLAPSSAAISGGSGGFPRRVPDRIPDRPDLVAERVAALLSRAADPPSRSDSC